MFARGEDVSFRNMVLSYGIGLRFEALQGFKFRIEWARSDEENTFLFKSDQIFQFLRLGYLYGRDPVPAR